VGGVAVEVIAAIGVGGELEHEAVREPLLQALGAGVAAAADAEQVRPAGVRGEARGREREEALAGLRSETQETG